MLESAKHMRSQWVFFTLRYLFTENRKKIAFQAFSLLLRGASAMNYRLKLLSAEGKVSHTHLQITAKSSSFCSGVTLKIKR